MAALRKKCWPDGCQRPARCHPRSQHFHARLKPPGPASPSVCTTWWACTFQSQPLWRGCWKQVRGQATAPTCWPAPWPWPSCLGKPPCSLGCDGFIGNRMIEHYLRHAGLLLDARAARPRNRPCAGRLWFRHGAIASMSDLGQRQRYHWLCHAARCRGFVDAFERHRQTCCAPRAVGAKECGRLVRPTPLGSHQAQPSATVQALLDAHRRSLRPRALAASAMPLVVQRPVLSLVMKVPDCCKRALPAAPKDIDGLCVGYGFPAPAAHALRPGSWPAEAGAPPGTPGPTPTPKTLPLAVCTAAFANAWPARQVCRFVTSAASARNCEKLL